MGSIDDFLTQLLSVVKLDDYYEDHLWFRQFVRYGITTTVIYWLAKAPLIWFLTNKLNLWYILSSFIVGLIITIMGFVVEKFFVFKRDEE